METRTLNWGETPWDAMPREELLRLTQKLYGALIAAQSVVSMARSAAAWPYLNSETPQERVGVELERIARDLPYWGPKGTGGRAYELVRQALELDADYGDTLYRSFYRYAYDLLFERKPGYELGFGWVLCPVCGNMVGADTEGATLTGVACGSRGFGRPGCEGMFRPLEWRDLVPEV